MPRDPVLVTGAAGFIGHAVAHALLARGEVVIGFDSLTEYYDPALKRARLATFGGEGSFRFVRGDIADAPALLDLVRAEGVVRIVHLAAQAGVRYSIDAPFAYQHANLAGHLSVLEACRHAPGFVHLVYASSSSVYGDRPLEGSAFAEDDPAMAPASLYAATKRAGELMGSAYAHLYRIPQTGLRFFTVYGPWGRPDMAIFGFTQKILAGAPIELFGEGRMARDFTYIDDIVRGVIGALDNPPPPGEQRLLNIGAGQPVRLTEMVDTLEAALGVKATRMLRPMQPGDVTATRADITRLHALTGYRPQVTLRDGITRFVAWYRDFYG